MRWGSHGCCVDKVVGVADAATDVVVCVGVAPVWMMRRGYGRWCGDAAVKVAVAVGVDDVEVDVRVTAGVGVAVSVAVAVAVGVVVVLFARR